MNFLHWIIAGIIFILMSLMPKQGDVRTVEVDGETRYYTVHRPETYVSGAPTLVVLHGGMMSMKAATISTNPTSAWLDVADREGFLLLIPNGYNQRAHDGAGFAQSWNDLRPNVPGRQLSEADDVAFIVAMLDQAEETLGIDRSKVCVAGASNGGMMTMRLLIEAPEHFAAGAAFIGGLPEGELPVPASPTPIMLLNGDEDPLILWDGGAVASGGAPTIPTPEMVDWWVRANGALSEAATTELLPDADPNDGCRISETTYPAGPEGAPVLFYRVEGGGHITPQLGVEQRGRFFQRFFGTQCRDAEGVDLAWEFMERYL